ncbi:MAG: acyltransferase [Candidatus Thorarchaeota archaeon]
MSSPVSIQDGPFTTNTLVSRKFLLIHILIIWGSFLPVLIELYFFGNIVDGNFIILSLLLPFQLSISYLILIITSTILSKTLLFTIKLIHQPKEGVFNKDKKDKDYYFWSLRAVIKKWPIWLSHFIPSSLITNLMLKIFGITTSYSNKISTGSIDTEFIELGRNVIIGNGSLIKSSMILRGHLIIMKVKIGDNVIIGSNSFIAPGTHIGSNTKLGTMSVTKFNQKLEPNSSYHGNLAKKIHKLYNDLRQIFANKELKKNSHIYENPEDKFVKSLGYNIITFGIVYFFSNFIPVLSITYFCIEYFFPLYLYSPNLFKIFLNIQSLLIFFITPLFLIFLILIHLLTVTLITKISYKIIQYKNPAVEGTFHWDYKTQDFNNYFKRSFVLRYAKWKIQRSPFPWLIKPAFNFIGSCYFGKRTVIENSYLAKEFIKVGKNSYLGKSLLANHLWDKNLTIKSIVIGNDVEISDNCCVAPGTEIENEVTLLPLSITSKYDKLSSNFIYYQSPLKKIPEEELVQIFNCQIGENHRD